MRKIAIEEGKKEKAKRMRKIAIEEGNNQQYMNQIKTMLYYDKVDKEVIEEIKKTTEVTDDKRVIMLLAICEKIKDVKQAQKIVKEAKESNFPGVDKLNIIMERIKSKKVRIFDFGFYDDILYWNFDESLSKQYQQELENEKKEKTSSREKKEVKTSEIVDKTKETDLQDIEARKIQKHNIYKEFNNRKRFQEEVRVNVKENHKIQVEEKQTVYMQMVDNILMYLQRHRKNVYVKMQSEDIIIRREAIKTSDKIDILMDDLKLSMKNINSKDLEERNKSEQFLQKVCERFKQIKEKQRIQDVPTGKPNEYNDGIELC